MLSSISGIAGEEGGTIQLSLTDSIAVFAGGGYNITSPVYNPVTNPPGYSLHQSGGYTIRGGAYFFRAKHRFFSFQFFYRKWAPTTVFVYNNGTPTDYADNYKLGDGITGDESATTGYTVNNCSIIVKDFDCLYGRQAFIGNQKHLIFEWYIGAGIRFKTIYNEELGQMGQGGQTFSTGPYLPSTPPTFSTENLTSLDFKLGIMIGYKL